MDHHARVNVFGHSLSAEPANFHQHTATEQPTASRKERAIVPITAGLKNTIEQRLLVLEGSLEVKILLKHVGVVEMVRRLDERNLIILKKSHRVLQETAGRNVIDVEDCDNFSRGFSQGMIQISGFGVLSL